MRQKVRALRYTSNVVSPGDADGGVQHCAISDVGNGVTEMHVAREQSAAVSRAHTGDGPVVAAERDPLAMRFADRNGLGAQCGRWGRRHHDDVAFDGRVPVLCQNSALLRMTDKSTA